MTRDSSEAKHRELHVAVVGCHDLTHIEQGAFILIVLVQSVQTIWSGRLTVWGCIVNGSHKGDCPSWSEIVYERGLFINLELLEYERSILAGLLGCLPLLEVVDWADCGIQIYALIWDKPEPEPEIFVPITQSSDGKILLLNQLLFTSILNGISMYCGKVLRARNFSLNLAIVGNLRYTAQRSSLIMDILPL